MSDLVTLYRPVGLAEWKWIERSGRRSFPPRLEHQPIFYPVLHLDYARKIASEWNTADPVSGYVGLVTAFDLPREFLSRYPVQRVGGATCEELWVPAEELERFNAHIVGPIRLLEAFYGEAYAGERDLC